MFPCSLHEIEQNRNFNFIYLNKSSSRNGMKHYSLCIVNPFFFSRRFTQPIHHIVSIYCFVYFVLFAKQHSQAATQQIIICAFKSKWIYCCYCWCALFILFLFRTKTNLFCGLILIQFCNEFVIAMKKNHIDFLFFVIKFQLCNYSDKNKFVAEFQIEINFQSH